jgi:hypothetical protein
MVSARTFLFFDDDVYIKKFTRSKKNTSNIINYNEISDTINDHCRRKSEPSTRPYRYPILEDHHPRAEVVVIKHFNRFKSSDIKRTTHVDQTRLTTPWKQRPGDSPLFSTLLARSSPMKRTRRRENLICVTHNTSITTICLCRFPYSNFRDLTTR